MSQIINRYRKKYIMLIEFIKNLISVPRLKREIVDLRQQNQELTNKLSEKQLQINRTNAFYKNLMRRGGNKKLNKKS
jgi:hypothetical protein